MKALIIHGGAWDIPGNLLEAHRAGCSKALNVGWDILQSNGSSVDAVEQTIRCLEDDVTFDAGCGSHLNADGQVELDASIMNGTTMRCGAVGAVHSIKNPITLARHIMDRSEHILLVGAGAEQFASEQGMRLCEHHELASHREIEKWNAARGAEHFSTKDAFRKLTTASDTVGAVALDDNGVICVGTSTGGTFNKHPGRVGDSPLIGCGTYADSELGGVSTTGWGEAMIKVVMAKTIIDIMQHDKSDPKSAADAGIEILQRKAEGFGGVIVMNARGEFGVAFNTPRMARAYRNSAMSSAIVEI